VEREVMSRGLEINGVLKSSEWIRSDDTETVLSLVSAGIVVVSRVGSFSHLQSVKLGVF
jgi:hypothetical protein